MLPRYLINQEIIPRLQDRFDLVAHPTVQNPLLFYPAVMPITNFDELLREAKYVEVTGIDLSAAANTYVPFHTVPDGKRWIILLYTTSQTVANSSPGIKEPNQSRFWIGAGGTTALYEWVTNLVLEEGWSIGRSTTGNGGDASENMGIYYIEEDSYKR